MMKRIAIVIILVLFIILVPSLASAATNQFVCDESTIEDGWCSLDWNQDYSPLTTTSSSYVTHESGSTYILLRKTGVESSIDYFKLPSDAKEPYNLKFKLKVKGEDIRSWSEEKFSVGLMNIDEHDDIVKQACPTASTGIRFEYQVSTVPDNNEEGVLIRAIPYSYNNEEWPARASDWSYLQYNDDYADIYYDITLKVFPPGRTDGNDFSAYVDDDWSGGVVFRGANPKIYGDNIVFFISTENADITAEISDIRWTTTLEAEEADEGRTGGDDGEDDACGGTELEGSYDAVENVVGDNSIAGLCKYACDDTGYVFAYDTCYYNYAGWWVNDENERVYCAWSDTSPCSQEDCTSSGCIGEPEPRENRGEDFLEELETFSYDDFTEMSLPINNAQLTLNQDGARIMLSEGGSYNNAKITITADDVILDCRGATLTGPGIEYGDGTAIAVAGAENVVVRNCNIENYYYGIELGGNPGAKNILLLANKIKQTYIGIYLASSSSNPHQHITLRNNVVTESQDGFYIYHAERLSLISNKLAGTEDTSDNSDGITLHNTHTTSFIDNYIKNFVNGVYLGSDTNDYCSNGVVIEDFDCKVKYSDGDCLTYLGGICCKAGKAGTVINSYTNGLWCNRDSELSVDPNQQGAVCPAGATKVPDANKPGKFYCSYIFCSGESANPDIKYTFDELKEIDNKYDDNDLDNGNLRIYDYSFSNTDKNGLQIGSTGCYCEHGLRRAERCRESKVEGSCLGEKIRCSSFSYENCPSVCDKISLLVGDTCDGGIISCSDYNYDECTTELSDYCTWYEKPPVETCDDGIDNDFDGEIDCLDPNCIGSSACQEVVPSLCVYDIGAELACAVNGDAAAEIDTLPKELELRSTATGAGLITHKIDTSNEDSCYIDENTIISNDLTALASYSRDSPIIATLVVTGQKCEVVLTVTDEKDDSAEAKLIVTSEISKEICNSGSDEDGDNLVDCADSDCVTDAYCIDADADGYSPYEGDCRDTRMAGTCVVAPATVDGCTSSSQCPICINPDATEYCDDEIDNDCDSLTDADDPDCTSLNIDSDNDGVPDADDVCSGTSSSLRVSANSGCVGDIDGTGCVDIDDLNLFEGIFFTSTTSTADINKDGFVDIDDLNLFEDNFFTGGNC